ncbi:hypothetical protein D3C72_2579780 [compost metagenome]
MLPVKQLQPFIDVAQPDALPFLLPSARIDGGAELLIDFPEPGGPDAGAVISNT